MTLFVQSWRIILFCFEKGISHPKSLFYNFTNWIIQITRDPMKKSEATLIFEKVVTYKKSIIYISI